MNKNTQEEHFKKFEKIAEEFLLGQEFNTDAMIEKLKNLKNLDKSDAVLLLNHLALKEIGPKPLLYIVKELGKHKEKSSLQVLTDILTGFKEDKDDYIKIRCAAATALGNIKDESSIVPLMYIMNDRQENYKLRLWSAEALGKIGSSQAVMPLMQIVSDEEEKSVYLKESAAKALGMIGDDRAVDSLINVIEAQKGMLDKFTYLKEKAVEALGKFRDKKDSRINALKNVLQDESSYVRASAIEALTGIEDEKITDYIEPMIYDKDEDVAKTAIYGLYNVKGRDYVIQLLERDDLPKYCREEIMEIMEEEQDDDESEE